MRRCNDLFCLHDILFRFNILWKTLRKRHTLLGKSPHKKKKIVRVRFGVQFGTQFGVIIEKGYNLGAWSSLPIVANKGFGNHCTLDQLNLFTRLLTPESVNTTHWTRDTWSSLAPEAFLLCKLFERRREPWLGHWTPLTRLWTTRISKYCSRDPDEAKLPMQSDCAITSEGFGYPVSLGRWTPLTRLWTTQSRNTTPWARNPDLAKLPRPSDDASTSECFRNQDRCQWTLLTGLIFGRWTLLTWLRTHDKSGSRCLPILQTLRKASGNKMNTAHIPMI